MVKVFSKKELERAIENKERNIIVYGELAEKLRKRAKAGKIVKAGGLVAALGGLIAVPFTGGLSTSVIGAGVTAFTVGSMTISTAELVVLCGLTISLYGVSKGYNVKFRKDGSVSLEKK